jgi:hypothetical protein
MKSKFLVWAVGATSALALALGTVSWGQSNRPVYLSGLINDFTPGSINGQLVGPWEVHGDWSLDLLGTSGRANFSAAITMGRSDQGVVSDGGGDFDTPAGRHAHTHHITLARGVVTPIANGFQVSGIATVSGNGSNPPDFAPLSPVTIVITGGTLVPLSNFQITFGDPADTHFGKNPIHGVVLQDR